MNDRVTLALQGEVTLEAFSNAVFHFNKLVNVLSAEAPIPEGLRWVITELEAGSAIATAQGVGDSAAAAAVASAFVGVGKSLERGAAQQLAPDVREEARRLVAVLEQGVEAVRFETAEADATIRSLQEAFASGGTTEPISPQPAAYGGVQGRVQTLSNRGALRFTLYDSLFDRAVSCYPAEGQEDLMRDAWGRVAVVEGVVTRDAATGRPQVVRRVRSVTLIREAEADAYLAVRGILGPKPSAPSPEETVRRLRDG